MSANPNMNSSLDSDESQVDFDQLKELFGFCLRAPKRRPWLAVSGLMTGLLIGIAAAVASPQEYIAEASILVQKTTDITAPPSQDSDGEAKRVNFEQILQRANLTSLARNAHIVEDWTKPKTGLARVKQSVQSLFSNINPKPERLEDYIVSQLEKNIWVRVEGNTCTVTAQWWSPQTAYDLATLAQKSFFDLRREAEISAISDGIDALEKHAKAEREAVDEALRSFEQAKAKIEQSASPQVALALPSTPGSRPQAAPRLSDIMRNTDPELKQKLEDKRRQIRELEDDRARRLTELRTQLAGLRSTYTDAHPAVSSVQSRIDALTAESPGERQLKAEERAILDKIMTSAEETVPKGGSGSGGAASVILPLKDPTGTGGKLSPERLAISAPEASMALATLQNRLKKYEETLEVISAARLRLDTAQTTFKHRYSVFRPAEMPKAPVKNRRIPMLIVGVVLGVALAVFVAVVADLLSGRVLEAWQVHRKLRLRQLGEVVEP